MSASATQAVIKQSLGVLRPDENCTFQLLSYYLSQCLQETAFNIFAISDTDFYSQSPSAERVSYSTRASGEAHCVSVGSDWRAANFLEASTLTVLFEQNPKIKLVNDETDGHLHVPNCSNTHSREHLHARCFCVTWSQ